MENEINDEVKSNNKNSEILDVLGEITSLINQYIADNQENLNLVQLKLSLLLKTIQELFYPKNINLTPNIEIKKINLLNSSDNSNVINAKTIYNIQKKLNENKFFSVNLNSSTVGNLYEQNNSNSEYIYEIINLKRKLKEEHEKYLLRELAYLDRISVIQNQLKKYENEKINQKFPNISDINSNDEAQAYAFWDDATGKLSITSKKEGASYINIEAGTSNFTDVMGLTSSEWNDDGTVKSSKMFTDAQELGKNAQFTINGTSMTSTSNTVTSDVSRINGVTLTLKKASTEESGTTKLSVSQDTSGLVDAVKSFVSAYNDVISKVLRQVLLTVIIYQPIQIL